MKRFIEIFLTMLMFVPVVVEANIVCNDGTVSPSCSTCRKGCCSRHGGCSSSSTSSSGSSSSSHNNSSSSGSGSSSSTNKKPATPAVVKSSDATLKKVMVDDTEITISDSMTYTTTNEKATIEVVANDTKAVVNYPTNPDLIIGENGIDIKVTAENGNVKNYKLTITREKILSNNANIKIFVNGTEIVFNSFTSDVINIPNEQEQLDITYELEDINAQAEIMGNENLQVGHNEIIVKVTAENGEEQDYTLMIEREAKKVEIPEEQEETVAENSSNSNNPNNQNNVDNPILSVCIILGLVSIISYFVIIGLRKSK